MSEPNQIKIEYQPCPICQLPLSEGEIALNRVWHFDCEKCVVCGHAISSELITKALSAGELPTHTACAKQITLQRLRERTLPLLAQDIQTANEEILAFQNIFNPETADIELLSRHLIAMKEHVANVSWMLQLTRDKIRIKESQDYSEKIKVERKVRVAKETAQAEKKQISDERAAMLEYERNDKSGMLRNWRKAIETTVKSMSFLGWDAIEAMVEGQLATDPEWIALKEANAQYFALVKRETPARG
jgi:hypothetical protein